MSPATQPRWVTFDCFGTLVDWQAAFSAVLTAVAGDRANDVADAYDAHERLAERARPHRTYRDVLARGLEAAIAGCGVPRSRSGEDMLAQVWNGLRVFDDVEGMLAELRRRGYRLAVLTNCDDDLFEITHRSFQEPFDLFLTAERVRGYKPAAWHFRAFEQLTGVSRRGWAHVGCSWYHDIAPAHALGIRSVWLDRERAAAVAPATAARVHSAAEVADTVGRLLDAEMAPGGMFVAATPGVC